MKEAEMKMGKVESEMFGLQVDLRWSDISHVGIKWVIQKLKYPGFTTLANNLIKVEKRKRLVEGLEMIKRLGNLRRNLSIINKAEMLESNVVPSLLYYICIERDLVHEAHNQSVILEII